MVEPDCSPPSDEPQPEDGTGTVMHHRHYPVPVLLYFGGTMLIMITAVFSVLLLLPMIGERSGPNGSLPPHANAVG
ncbi:hypothetical protein [Bradyrhizobium tropiciagri]|uniref:hypothetical protein n=1 Tax=Bradyrhizobium tropiciagri TaxID=312253 RepID=UPI00067C794A|nr:hypothetical protein [Bradyrhizobium tropiciagri]